MKTYVTFGQQHAHEVNGKQFDKDTVAVIEAQSSCEGRKKAFELFDDKFCFEYYDNAWDDSKIALFAKGYVTVE